MRWRTLPLIAALLSASRSASATPGVTPTSSELLEGAAIALVPTLGVNTSPSFMFGWPVALPLPLGHTPHRHALLHKLVIDPRFDFGAAPQVRFELRSGYRAVVRMDGHDPVGVALGLGSTIQTTPDVRPSISPEVGVHVRLSEHEGHFIDPAMLFLVQGDWFPGGTAPHLRGILSVGLLWF